MNQAILQLVSLMESVHLDDPSDRLRNASTPEEVLSCLNTMAIHFPELSNDTVPQEVPCNWINNDTLKVLIYQLKRNTDDRVVSGCLYCMAGILRRGHMLKIYIDLVRDTDLGYAVERALQLNKHVTLKSAVRPFDIVRNSALFLIYYGYCVVAFNQLCPDKTQDALLQVYTKADKGKYAEYIGLDRLLTRLREEMNPVSEDVPMEE